MKKHAHAAVLGAGISGCAAAQLLQAKDIDYQLFEMNVEAGGLTRSITVNEACFDYSGHYLHLAHFKSPADIPYANQEDGNWQLVQRRSVVYVRETLVPAPFQYNLYALPGDLRNSCMDRYHDRPARPEHETLKDYLLSGFGAGICDLFLFPYSEKHLAIPLEDLSTGAINRFFPPPDERMISAGADKLRGPELSGYNSSFWYPKHNGIGILASGLAADLRNIYYCYAVNKIDLKKKRIHTAQGAYDYTKLVTSIPLNDFCLMTDNQHLRKLAGALSHNRVLCLNVLVKGSFHPDFNEYHWVYTPEDHIPFYRLGFYSHFDHTHTPPGYTALYIESAINHRERSKNTHRSISDIMDFLERQGWAKKEDCVILSASWIDCAYVHFDHNREKTLQEIMVILGSLDVIPIGRYGRWDYISMEDSILSGFQAAEEIAAAV